MDAFLVRKDEKTRLGNTHRFYVSPDTVFRNDGLKDLELTKGDSVKIAAFDLDGTLIHTRSKSAFAKDSQDWEPFSDEVKPKLKALHDEGYVIVIFTNQKGLTSTRFPISVADFKTKMRSIVSLFDVPIAVYAAMERDRYRKPNTGMFRMLKRDLRKLGVSISETCVFVGDAAGRPKDHSADDKGLWENIVKETNVQWGFRVPEDFWTN
ncbi:Polynucleotide kinase 3 phosphatase [Carpediemonas membranifera]|uniref:Polynucleotide kinase 3 phosphatase n=1 Tax=Carpediemonas membranifera TaxID=201153 RepID=A0A8J6E237_9EUKA|nr:Polynucleotide kinase 3 phosphatase [Carpediemonas membranifera]|eukprot:KAG9391402.1 Polynucleotide kinase 3 phosphatase [Carpediemonas membranifera]